MAQRQALDTALSIIEAAFLSVLDEKRRQESEQLQHLPYIEIERERWRQPDVTFTLRGEINRNVHAYFAPSSNGVELTVEINAWKDKQEAGQNVQTRYWQNKEIDRFVVGAHLTVDMAHLHQTLDTAYSTVSQWQQADLVRQTIIPPSTEVSKY